VFYSCLVMKHWIAAVVAVGLVAGGWSCKRRPSQVETVEDENQPALSVVQVAHPRAAGQLLSGFHQVEQNAWRWTMGKFAVILMPPPSAAQKGARLELHFTLPQSVVSLRQSVTVAAAVEETALPPQTYTKAGTYVYKADVPAAALFAGTPVKVSFTLDKFIKAGEVETRELGLVVNTIGLMPK
jgi:hypothetical protein